MRDRAALLKLAAALAGALALSGPGWAAGQGGGAEPPAEGAVRTDLDMLARFVALPVRPEAASFEMREVGSGGPGPTDQSFVALLRYDAAGFERVRELLDAAGREPQGLRIAAPDWLGPTPLAPAGREGDDLVLEGEAARRVEPFARGGLLDGVAMPLADGRHVLLGHDHALSGRPQPQSAASGGCTPASS